MLVDELAKYWGPRQFFKGQFSNETSTRFCILGIVGYDSPLPKALRDRINWLLNPMVNSPVVLEYMREKYPNYLFPPPFETQINWSELNDTGGQMAVYDVLRCVEENQDDI